MTMRPLGPADHAFVSALSALSLAAVVDAREEALYLDVANRMIDRLGGVQPPVLQRLVLEFAAFRMSMPNPHLRPSARFHLAAALHEFHRWRMAMAVGAVEAQKPEQRDT